MSGSAERKGIIAVPTLPVLVSIVIVLLIVVSGVGYACSTGGGGLSSSNLIVTSLSKTSGPAYAVFALVSPLPTTAAVFKVGPFAPGDSAVVSYTVKNTGGVPASLSTLGVSVSGAGFTASGGPIPAILNPGSSFSSTITITLKSGLGDSYEGTAAVVSLKISGVATTTATTCTATATFTSTRVVTVTTTQTVTSTKTVTTYYWISIADASPLGLTTSSCTTLTFTITSTLTTTYTNTYTTYTTVTRTITTNTCVHHDNCK